MWHTAFSLFIGIVIGSACTSILMWTRIKNQTAQPHGNKSLPPVRIEDWAFLATGISGHLEIEQAWLRAAQKLYGIFCAKQHDYGTTNIGMSGLTGIALRMGDKLSRLWELTGLGEDGGEHKQALVAEGLEDTLFDLADYSLIGTIVLAGIWPRCTPSQVWGAGVTQQSLE